MSIIPGTNYTITKQKAIGKVTSVTKDPFSPLTVGRAYTGVKSFKVAKGDIDSANVSTQTAHGLSSGDVVIYHSEGGNSILEEGSSAATILTTDVHKFDNSFRKHEAVHGWETGQKVRYYRGAGAGTEATGLAHEGTYYIIKVDNYSFKVASSKKNAENGVEVAITSDGHSSQAFYRLFNDNEAFWINRASADTFTLHRTYADAIADTNEVLINDTDNLQGNDNQTFSVPFGKFDPADA
tara:strand:+ start:80 stop:796 length:717 start_codon:yes stop_codon:yes gene_type:complete